MCRVRPNPSIERTSQGLRPCAASHVKRYAKTCLTAISYSNSKSSSLVRLGMQYRYTTVFRLIFGGLALASTHCATADVIDRAVPFVQRGGSTSTSVVSPADISFFDAYDTASVQITGGEVSWLTMHDSSTASISGGELSWIQLRDSSSVRITGVEDMGWLVLSGTASRAEIVASNVQYSGGHLSGYWGSGRSFNFWVVENAVLPSNTLPSNVLISSVPEPSTAILFLCGIALFTTRKINFRG